jgi:hypothetical protein
MKSGLAAIAAAGLLIVGVDSATFAATGDSLILGHVNKASQPTVLTKTGGSGPALKLNSGSAGSPALAVNSKARVAKLNADMVDGKSANQLLQTKNVGHVYKTAATGGTGQTTFNIPNFPAGAYLVTYTTNFFPQGTAGAPIQFSCFLTRNNVNISQATGLSAAGSGFYIGVDGSTVVKLGAGIDLNIACGTLSGAWTFGTLPITVTVTRLDGSTSGGLPLAARTPHTPARAAHTG